MNIDQCRNAYDSGFHAYRCGLKFMDNPWFDDGNETAKHLWTLGYNAGVDYSIVPNDNKWTSSWDCWVEGFNSADDINPYDSVDESSKHNSWHEGKNAANRNIR